MKSKIKKDWLGRAKGVEELHNDSKQWLSEIDFINDELRFLNDLLGCYFLDIIDAGLSDTVKTIIKKIEQKEKETISFKLLIIYHEKTLSNLIKTNSVSANTNYLKIHQELELKVRDYFRKSKLLKKQIFSIVESQMERRAQKKLL